MLMKKMIKMECVCETCNKNFIHETNFKYYKKRFCSEECRISYSNKKQKETCLQKYGVISPTLNKEVRRKQEETCLERYGNKTTFKCESIKNKGNKTKLDKYGDLNYNNPDKMKRTNLQRYGVEHAMSNYNVKTKAKQKMWDYHYDKVKNRMETCNVNLICNKKDYKGSGINKIYTFECIICKNKFDHEFIRGLIPRCLKCFPYNVSKNEYDIRKIIITNDEILYNDKKEISPKELDIYIPNKKIAIEYDSFYYHSELSGKKPKNYHINKTLECEKKGIRLIHIFEDEWRYKQEIVKSKLNHLLNNNTTNKIYARKCVIREINYSIASIFLETNHLQGKDASLIKIGLFYNDELVSVMTFGKLRTCLGNSNINGQWELYRFCSKINTSIIGGASKLLNYFIKTYNPIKITSYADRRWSIGNLYEKIGFKKISDTPPNYWYFGRGNSYKRHHRFGFAKHTLAKKLKFFDSGLSEWENMKTNGWDRIWDCGSIKYDLTPRL